MPKKGYRKTRKHCERISKALSGKKRSKETKEKIALALMGRKIASHTKVFMQRREEYKRDMFKRLINHLEYTHPEIERKQYKGYSLWRNCPICNAEMDTYKVVEKHKDTMKQNEKTTEPAKVNKRQEVNEEEAMSKAVEEGMKLGAKKVTIISSKVLACLAEVENEVMQE